MSNTILEFKDKYRFLSNFYKAELVWDKIIWPSSEHAYQAAKSADRATRLAISKVLNPATIKHIGRGAEFVVNEKTYKVVTRSDWEQIKIKTMEEIVRLKFRQNGDLTLKLLDTGDSIIEEGNTWKDKFWGIYPPGSGDGRNELGKILMKIRNEAKNWNIVFENRVEPTHFTKEEIKQTIWEIEND